jgi:hypothetical protein
MLTPTLKAPVLPHSKAQSSSRWAVMLSLVTIKSRGTNLSLAPRKAIKMGTVGSLSSNTAEIDNFKLIKNKYSTLKIWMITSITWALSTKSKNSICSRLIHHARTLREEATKSLNLLSLSRTTNTNRDLPRRNFKVIHLWEVWAKNLDSVALKAYWCKIKTILQLGR